MLAFFAATVAAAQSWTPQTSGTTASLRGINAVSDLIAWASGTEGTYLRTTDGGKTWTHAQVPGAESLDFRGVHALDDRAAWLLASGPGDKSRIYRTTDGGAHWQLQFTNPDPGGFLDALVFYDGRRALALGDPVNGRFVLVATEDGEHWTRREGPPALPGEGAFAASNSCLIVSSKRDVWFATGAARVFHSTDGGLTWTVSQTPIRHDGPGAGIFSLAFRDDQHGIAVGGDYTKPAEAAHNIAVTKDGGRTWTEPASRPTGYRSAITYYLRLPVWIAVGPSGSDYSIDGTDWARFDPSPYNAISFPFAVGPKGAIAVFAMK